MTPSTNSNESTFSPRSILDNEMKDLKNLFVSDTNKLKSSTNLNLGLNKFFRSFNKEIKNISSYSNKK